MTPGTKHKYVQPADRWASPTAAGLPRPRAEGLWNGGGYGTEVERLCRTRRRNRQGAGVRTVGGPAVTPQSRTNPAPVEKVASTTMKSTVRATSSGLPNRGRSCPAVKEWSNSPVIAVRTARRWAEQARIRSGAGSSAAALTSPSRPQLLPTYDLMPARPVMPVIEEMFTTTLPPAWRSDGAVVRMRIVSGATGSAPAGTISRWRTTRRRVRRPYRRPPSRRVASRAARSPSPVSLPRAACAGWRAGPAMRRAPRARASVTTPRDCSPPSRSATPAQGCTRLRPWSAAYAANTSVGVPPVWRKRWSRMAARSLSAPASSSPASRTSGRRAACPCWARAAA